MHTVSPPPDNPPPPPVPYFSLRAARYHREFGRWAAVLGLLPESPPAA